MTSALNSPPFKHSLESILLSNHRRGAPLLAGAYVFRGSRHPDLGRGGYFEEGVHASLMPGVAFGYANSYNDGQGYVTAIPLDRDAVFYPDFGAEHEGASDQRVLKDFVPASWPATAKFQERLMDGSAESQRVLFQIYMAAIPQGSGIPLEAFKAELLRLGAEGRDLAAVAVCDLNQMAPKSSLKVEELEALLQAPIRQLAEAIDRHDEAGISVSRETVRQILSERAYETLVPPAQVRAGQLSHRVALAASFGRDVVDALLAPGSFVQGCAKVFRPVESEQIYRDAVRMTRLDHRCDPRNPLARLADRAYQIDVANALASMPPASWFDRPVPPSGDTRLVARMAVALDALMHHVHGSAQPQRIAQMTCTGLHNAATKSLTLLGALPASEIDHGAIIAGLCKAAQAYGFMLENLNDLANLVEQRARAVGLAADAPYQSPSDLKSKHWEATDKEAYSPTPPGPAKTKAQMQEEALRLVQGFGQLPGGSGSGKRITLKI